MLCHIYGMNLRDWRIERRLTLQEVATVLDMGYSRNFQRYEIGMVMPDAPLIEAIFVLTEGKVTAADLVAQRLAWLTDNRPDLLMPRPVAPPIPEAAE